MLFTGEGRKENACIKNTFNVYKKEEVVAMYARVFNPYVIFRQHLIINNLIKNPISGRRGKRRGSRAEGRKAGGRRRDGRRNRR